MRACGKRETAEIIREMMLWTKRVNDDLPELKQFLFGSQ